MFGKNDNRLKCSFCGKSQDQVEKLIAGPGVYICDECVGLCNEIIEEEAVRQGKAMPYLLLTDMAGLMKKRALKQDEDRMPSEGPDQKHRECLENAIKPLEKLLEFYENDAREKVNEAYPENSASDNEVLVADDQDEDLYRALIMMKTRLEGGEHPDLVPLLDKLSSIYTKRGFYNYSGKLHEWMLSIVEEKGSLLSKDLEALKKELLKIYIKGGLAEKADALVDELLKSEEPEK